MKFTSQVVELGFINQALSFLREKKSPSLLYRTRAHPYQRTVKNQIVNIIVICFAGQEANRGYCVGT